MGLKYFVYRAFCIPSVGRVVGAVFRDNIPNHGVVVDTAHPSIDPFTKASLFWGFYERPERLLIQRHLDPTLEVVELGSNIGVVACHVARQLAPGRRMVCVEANPGLVPILEKNLRRNAPGTRVDVYAGAIDYGDTGASEVLFSLGSDLLGSALAQPCEVASSASVRVKAFTLAQLLDLTGIDEYTLVVDIEGAEVALFDTESAALERCRHIFIEIHPLRVNGEIRTIEATIGKITRHGFRLIDQSESRAFAFVRV